MSRVDAENWEFTTEFPAKAEVVFLFQIDDKHILSENYEVVADQHGDQLNYLKVAEPYTDYGELKVNYPESSQYFLKLPPMEDGVHRVLTSRVVGFGKFEGVKELTEEMKKSLFDNDWQRFGMEEAISEPIVREKLCGMLYKYYDEIRNIFRIYSTQGAKDMTHMNVMQFCTFLYTCKFPEAQKSPITKFDELFHLVNMKMEWAEDGAGPCTANVVEDPLSMSHRFMRPEFMQALVRIAQLKYRALGPDASIDRLMKEHVLPIALTPDKEDIRTQYMDNNTQKVITLYGSRLYKMYLLYSSKNRGPDQVCPSITVANFDRLCQEHKILEPPATVKKICFQQFEIEMIGKDPVPIPPPTDDYEMTYSEFLEGIVRLAVHLWPPPEEDEEPTKLCFQVEALFMKMFPTPTNKRNRKVRTAFIGFRPEQ